ncbi:MAG: hypothetical protein QFX33_01090 [Candidatus Nezhaarchaeota archaeon]|nr:hypothetical protein [Candidatus Nezhaarchaeota archaeon]
MAVLNIVLRMLLTATVFVWVTAASLPVCHAIEEPNATIEVYANGAAYVTLSVPEVVNESLTLPIIGKPENNTITVSDDEGIPLQFIMGEGVLEVYALGSSMVTVEYATYSLCSMQMGLWTINISSPYAFSVILPRGAEVTYVDRAPSAVTVQDGKIVMSFSKGPTQMRYIMPALYPGGEGGQEGPADGGGVLTPVLWPLIAVGAVAASAVGVLVVAITKRKPVAGVEEAVVSYLKKRGGSAFQDEISRDLSLPKSTLSRAVTSLKNKGMVRVKRVSRRNYVVLS